MIRDENRGLSRHELKHPPPFPIKLEEDHAEIITRLREGIPPPLITLTPCLDLIPVLEELLHIAGGDISERGKALL